MGQNSREDNKLNRLIDEEITSSYFCIVEVETLISDIIKASNIMINALRNGNKIITCGNGGSASQAMHFTGELVGRFLKERKPLASVCLNTDVVNMTAVGNDYGYDKIFRRQIEAIGKAGDVLVCFSTSGNSENLLQAVRNIKGINVINLLGKGGGKMKYKGDVDIIIRSNDTARIQECHLLILHILAKLIENDNIR